jgi:iron-sulfur cluster assembly accessory protein
MIEVSENAVKHLRELVPDPTDRKTLGLRLFIEKGGCSGLSYGMKIAAREEGDATIMPAEDVQLFVDPESEPHLRGCTIDYNDGLTGAGFRILNPNAVRTCGCGTSFESSAQQ